MLLTQILETYSTNEKHETGRLKHTRTEENVITVNEMVGLLNDKDQKQTYHPTGQISKETDLTKCSIVQIQGIFYIQTGHPYGCPVAQNGCLVIPMWMPGHWGIMPRKSLKRLTLKI